MFSPDGHRLASASLDQTVKVWDAANGQELRTLKGHTNLILSVAFSPDGQRLVSACMDSSVKIWETASGRELRTLNTGTRRGSGVWRSARTASGWPLPVVTGH